MAIIGSIQGYGNSLTGVISSAEYMGGQIVGMRGLKGERGDDGSDGQDGQNGTDGFSPIANVTKTGDTATITITDKNGTTTATVSDGSAGGGGYIAEYGETAFLEVYTAFNDGKTVVCRYGTRDDGDFYLPLIRWNGDDEFTFKTAYKGLEYVISLKDDVSPAWSVSTSSDNALIATIDDTTFDEVLTAYLEGRPVYALYESNGTLLVPLVHFTSLEDEFTFYLPTENRTVLVSLSYHNTWSTRLLDSREIYHAEYEETGFSYMADAIDNGLVVGCSFNIQGYAFDGIAFSCGSDLGNGTGETDYIYFHAIISLSGTAPKVFYFYVSNTDGITYWSPIETANTLRDADLVALYGKQDALVSGTNIKTINNESLLGSGNMTITDTDTTYTLSMTNNVITLTGSDSSTSSVTLPVYNGGVI